MTNNTPTAPGWYYRDEPMIENKIVLVRAGATGTLYWMCLYEDGGRDMVRVMDYGSWLGPVPMPGEWVPMDLADRMSSYVASVEDGRPGMEILEELADYKNRATAQVVT